jgi:hypothetical protein
VAEDRAAAPPGTPLFPGFFLYYPSQSSSPRRLRPVPAPLVRVVPERRDGRLGIVAWTRSTCTWGTEMKRREW